MQHQLPRNEYSAAGVGYRFASTLIGLIILYICKDAIIMPIRNRIYDLIWRLRRKSNLKRYQEEVDDTNISY